MDADLLDRIARTLSSTCPRRGVLGFVATLPLLGGLTSLVATDETDAKGRGKRGKKNGPARHDRPVGAEKKRKKKRKKKTCKPQSTATTCAGKCGPVKNNCKKTVDCGSCACNPTCTTCLTCNETTRTCAVDPRKEGDACGSPGQICQAGGSCLCDEDSCGGTAPICDEGACVACSDQHPCPSGCCAADGSCKPGDSKAFCGPEGDACTACNDDLELCGVAGACESCDVCADACDFSSVQDAIDGAEDGEMILICPGTYHRDGDSAVASINGKSLTLRGAGTGAGGTILDGGGEESISPVIFAEEGGTIRLEQLTVTGSNGQAAIYNIATMILSGVEVSGNQQLRLNGTGGGAFNANQLTLDRGTRVTRNQATLGAGIANSGLAANLRVKAGASVTGNTATNFGGILNSQGTVILEAGSDVSVNIPDDCFDLLGGTGCP
jgi:hypothetical protein